MARHVQEAGTSDVSSIIAFEGGFACFGSEELLKRSGGCIISLISRGDSAYNTQAVVYMG